MYYYDTYFSLNDESTIVRILTNKDLDYAIEPRLVIGYDTMFVGTMMGGSNFAPYDNLPQEIVDLAKLVMRDRKNGPWRQLIDWIAQHLEFFPAVFVKRYLKFLEAGAKQPRKKGA